MRWSIRKIEFMAKIGKLGGSLPLRKREARENMNKMGVGA